MRHFTFYIIFCVLFISCSKSSTFVADNNNSLLPEYSESGRNVAGALFNDTVWKSDIYISQLSGTYMRGFWIISSLSGDSTTIIFNGTPVDFVVVIKGLKIENQDSLLKLNNATINFDNITSYVTLNYSANTFSFERYGECTGTIIFNKIQKNTSFTIGDGSPDNPKINPFIISGHFNFIINGTTNYKVEDGRFDMVAEWKTNLFITQ